MKNKTILVVLFIAVIYLASACGNQEQSDSEQVHDHGDGVEHSHEDGDGHDHDQSDVDLSSKEYASAYICPMHCEGSGSDTEGTCPVCEMEYRKNPDYTGEATEDSAE